MSPIAALITGANRGIGAALLTEMSPLGTVVGTARDTSALPTAETDTNTEWQPLDVADPSSITALAERLNGRPIERLICNAGVYLDKGDTLKGGFGAELWAQSMAVNVTGVFLTIQALMPNLQAASGPRIGIISSQMGSSARAKGGAYIYRASKAAVLNLGRNLATDLRAEGIAVGIYHPGWVRTDMGGDAASISTSQSAPGLAARIEALRLETTGCFEMWNGEAMPF